VVTGKFRTITDVSLTVVLGACAASLAGGFAALAQTSWVPRHPVELVAQSAPGGGTDVTARLVQRIWQAKGLVEQPVSVVNKAGGGGSVALSYMTRHPKDGHYLEVASTALLTSQITGASPFGFRDFAPIAILASDYLAFAVRSDSPVKTGTDLMAKLASNPTSMSIAIGTAAGGVNNVAAVLVARAAGVDAHKLKTVVFNSSAESALALLGGHVDLVVASVSEIIQFVEDKRVRVIAITAPQRLGGVLSVVPTWKEQRQEIVVDNFRPVIGAPDLGAQELAYWDRVFTETVETAEWQQDLEKNLWTNTYRPSKDALTYMESQYKELQAALSDIGLAKTH
jgi:putative tricarboxylic transport membrane protein